MFVSNWKEKALQATLASTSQVVILDGATKLAAAMAVRVIAILTINLLVFWESSMCVRLHYSNLQQAQP
jgi:hypothetical protein